jgi:hypothetical protein
MDFNLGTINWEAISSIVSCGVIITTLVTLRYNKRQLNEFKRQWEEENRARLNFSVVSIHGWILLKITNVGKRNAYNIKLHFDDEFISKLFSKCAQNVYKDLQSINLAIEPGKSNYYDISPCYSNPTEKYTYESKETFMGDFVNKWLTDNINFKIHIEGSYCDRYIINENFSISNFITKSMVVKDDASLALEGIKKELDIISSMINSKR